MLLVAALVVLSVVVWRSPQLHHDTSPSAVDVELSTEQARADDLAEQNRRKDELLRRPRPPDDSDEARADDLKHQLDEALKSHDGRADDLAGQLHDAETKLRARRSPLSGDPSKSRADDLARQLHDTETKLTALRTTVLSPVVAFLSKQQIIGSTRLFGLYTAQGPFSYSEIGFMQSEVHRKANMVGYFQNWTDPFRPDAIEATWRHGQIPLLTWEPTTPSGRVDPPFTLRSIIDGVYDDYIWSYAQGIRQLGLPVVVRLAHEMNGYWYPWSEIRKFDDTPINGNQRGEYVQMWRHVHDIFQQANANDLTVWLWAPNRVDQIPLQPHVSEFYPGDQYVDWVGMSGYLRGYPDEQPTFDDVYARTLTELRETTTKPILLAEIGATETGGQKTEWERDLFKGLARNTDVIGFVWFNLTVSGVRWGEMQTADWRINSTSASRGTVAAGLASSEFGLPPTG